MGLMGLMGRIAGRFARVEPRRRAARSVLGLVADLPRKNCWTIACSTWWAGPSGMPIRSATTCAATWWSTRTTTGRRWSSARPEM